MPSRISGRIRPLVVPLLLLAGWSFLLIGPPSGDGVREDGPVLPGPLPDRLQVSSVPAPVEPEDGPARELGQRIREAMASLGGGEKVPEETAPPAAVPVRRAGSLPPSLEPRQTPLTDRQLRGLSELRWRQPGKALAWRTGPHRHSLTWLAGRLLEPAADVARDGMNIGETTARRFLAAHADLLALESPETELELRSGTRDSLGYTQLRFDQRYHGLRVWPCALMVQLDPRGNVTLLTGSYAPTPSTVDPVPHLDAAGAASRARLAVPGAGAALVQDQELVVYAPFDGPDRLAWRIDLRASPVLQWDVFVDAADGRILNTVTQVATGAATGTGTDLAGVNRTIHLWQHTDSRFYLVDTSKEMFDPSSVPPNPGTSRGVITVMDMQNASRPDPAAGVHNTATSPAGPWRADAVSASVNLSRVYDYYRERFNRNSVNGTGGSMMGIVNLDDDNAYSDFQTLTMIFGNRDRYSEALDVVAHEMTHSVISTTSKLVYEFQSGALNEAFADILGEGCEAHFNGGVPDWKLGTSLRQVFRVFDNPGSKTSSLGRPYPSKFSQFEVLDKSVDQGGVHINSSIINHSFYLLAEGMQGAVGLSDALQIHYRAVTTKLNPQSQFVDCRLACVASAEELFGAGSVQVQKTAEAFDLVEILDQPARQNPAPIPPVDALDSTLFIFPSSGSTWLGRREAFLQDDGAGVFLGANNQRTPVMPWKKPAVAGNGQYGLYVRPDADAAFIDTQTGQSTPLNFTGRIESVGLSADGTVQAYVLRTENGQADRRIYVFDTKTQQTKTYTAVQPLVNQTGTDFTNTILSVDALDLTPDGRFIYYDALNRLTFPGGGFTDSYSIYVIDRETDTISNLVPPIPGVQVGNPSVGKTRPELITFDVTDANGLSLIYVADLHTGGLRVLSVLGAGAQVFPGWPGYSGDDAAVVYTNYQFDPGTFSYVSYLESQPVQEDGMTPSANPFAWLAGSSPSLGLIYRRGEYSGLPSLFVEAVVGSTAEGSPVPARIRVTRTGPTVRSLPFSFVLTGTARNGADFVEIGLNAAIAAGSPVLEIPVQAVDDGEVEGAETVTLTLSEAIEYRIGAQKSVTLTIEDNDTDGGLTFAAWAAQNGIDPSDYTGDADRDGRRNFVEYALGSNPAGANAVADPMVSVIGGRLHMTVSRTRTAPDVDYIVEVADSPAGPWASGNPHTSVVTTTDTLLQVRDETQIPPGGRRFARLRITKR